MIEVVLDFETANGVVDLGRVGSAAYARHWATEILCLRWRDSRFPGVTHLWLPNTEWDDECRALFAVVRRHDAIFIAQNAGFEKDIWRAIMVPYFGFPDIPNERWHDTMAVALRRVLPGALEKVLPVLGLPGKDMVGSKLTRSLSKVNKKTGMFDRSPETMKRVYQYCAKDVDDEVALHAKLGYLEPAEHKVWLLDQEINERGLRFDVPMIQGALKIYDQVAPQMIAEFRDLTGGLNPTQREKVLGWVQSQGVDLGDMKKGSIEKLLGLADEGDDDEDIGNVPHGVTNTGTLATLPGNVERALHIRNLIGSSSVSKYRRMAECVDVSGRIYRLLQYHGAGTGRWAGRVLNPHNMPRGLCRVPGEDGKLHAPDHNQLAAAIQSGDPAALVSLGLVLEYGATRVPAHPIEILAHGLRNTVIAAEDKVLEIGDWSNIEARLDLAIAGQRDKCDLLAAGLDPYLDVAEQIYHVQGLTKDDVEKRQTGKNTVLGCGFQMGPDKFCMRYCPECHCRDLGVAECKVPESGVRQFAARIVSTYREEWAPRVPELWQALQNAALAAAQNPGKAYGAHGIEYRVEGDWLVGHCPDGSALYYFKPVACKQKTRWGVWKDTWRYQVFGQKGVGAGASGQWVYAYGGLLTENYVQHQARQLLCRGLRRCKEEGRNVVLHNHDEIVCEVEPGRTDAKGSPLKAIMEERPNWAGPGGFDVPIAAECWSDFRYKKG